MTGTALKPIDEVRQNIERMGPEFERALPSHISVEKFKRVAITAINQQPDLLNCDKRTLYAAVMKAAQDGLLPDGRDAAIVKFGEAAQYMPMTSGILKKIRNSGELKSISAHVVYDKDEFNYQLGDNEYIVHTPSLAEDRGKPKAVYAIAHLKDGGIQREVMSVAQVEQVRAVSRAGRSGPWVQWWDEMARKTVLRRLSKRLPMSTDLDKLTNELGEEPYGEFREVAPSPALTADQGAPPPDFIAKGKPTRLKAISSAAVEPAEEVVQGITAIPTQQAGE